MHHSQLARATKTKRPAENLHQSTRGLRGVEQKKVTAIIEEYSAIRSRSKMQKQLHFMHETYRVCVSLIVVIYLEPSDTLLNCVARAAVENYDQVFSFMICARHFRVTFLFGNFDDKSGEVCACESIVSTCATQPDTSPSKTSRYCCGSYVNVSLTCHVSNARL